MKMAEILKTLYPYIDVKGKCASSCVLLWLSGAIRVTNHGAIGIHRPYFNPEYFRGLSVTEAKKRYSTMSKEYRTFVLRQGLPRSLYEKLNATPSEDMYWLTTQDIKLIGTSPPYFEEKILATCGEFLGNDIKPKEAAICVQRVPAPERIHGVDQLIGNTKDELWERLKEQLARKVR